MDIAIAITKFLEDKSELRDMENDSVNIADNQIHSWNFTNIPCPTAEELESCFAIASAKISQDEINAEARKYLADTDYKIIKSIETGIPVSEEITIARAAARARIV